ncbi:TIGR00730 family Rossman fold protein [Comamonas flocculans]|uniref:Cytokinin riboside 5'-monophosphate phosphoribohydrolase n=1 Tax=Comamonas flocculans TaxID=2597701 RepID=A0A5B8RSM0_9BURK|nr:TIGR00730 family Rossman fold protein [Comamonas flocculans]QEA12113.1 TIGR00730 family Rossman fold protein [Comamonas flocculans]
MDANTELRDPRLMQMWGELDHGPLDSDPLKPDAYRLAFIDPEFLQRRETRGIRFQLELLKPDLDLAAQEIESTVVVYGSARTLAPDAAQAQLEAARAGGDARALALAERKLKSSHYYAQARLFARHVAEYSQGRPPAERLTICTGGGPGIMEAANRGAHDVGAPSIGLNITLPHEQSCNRYITPSLAFKFHYFALRKMHFMMRAKALVVFPGGFGTMDELFEVLTLVQTRKAKPVPIVLFGSQFWSRVLNLDVLVEEGTISEDDLALFHVTDDAQQAWEIIRNFYAA